MKRHFHHTSFVHTYTEPVTPPPRVYNDDPSRMVGYSQSKSRFSLFVFPERRTKIKLVSGPDMWDLERGRSELKRKFPGKMENMNMLC